MLVAHHEGRWFSTEILKGPIERIGGKRAVKKVEIQLEDNAGLKERYSGALKDLEAQVVAGTRRPDRTKPAGPK
jgi:ATP-dependent RNA helicase DDX51/DBP6